MRQIIPLVFAAACWQYALLYSANGVPSPRGWGLLSTYYRGARQKCYCRLAQMGRMLTLRRYTMDILGKALNVAPITVGGRGGGARRIRERGAHKHEMLACC